MSLTHPKSHFLVREWRQNKNMLNVVGGKKYNALHRTELDVYVEKKNPNM